MTRNEASALKLCYEGACASFGGRATLSLHRCFKFWGESCRENCVGPRERDWWAPGKTELMGSACFQQEVGCVCRRDHSGPVDMPPISTWTLGQAVSWQKEMLLWMTFKRSALGQSWEFLSPLAPVSGVTADRRQGRSGSVITFSVIERLLGSLRNKPKWERCRFILCKIALVIQGSVWTGLGKLPEYQKGRQSACGICWWTALNASGQLSSCKLSLWRSWSWGVCDSPHSSIQEAEAPRGQNASGGEAAYGGGTERALESVGSAPMLVSLCPAMWPWASYSPPLNVSIFIYNLGA